MGNCPIFVENMIHMPAFTHGGQIDKPIYSDISSNDIRIIMKHGQGERIVGKTTILSIWKRIAHLRAELGRLQAGGGGPDLQGRGLCGFELPH
jgi:hypothetical protein